MENDRPDSEQLEEIEAFAVQLAREAGEILMKHFPGPLEIEFKGEQNRDPVTIADRRSEEYLKKAIGEKFPEHGILGEEGGTIREATSPFVWVIDPLDGTNNFMNGLPFFAVSIGVLWKGRPAAGSIFTPVSHRAGKGTYHARLDAGAFLDDERIHVAAEPTGRPLAGIPSFFRLSGQSRKEPRESRNLGSIALELAMTACGVLQFTVFGAPRLWDAAAGVLLIREAGGTAFTRRRGQRGWIPLETFLPEPVSGQEKIEDPERLRKWQAPLIAGAPEPTLKLVKDIRMPRRQALRRVLRKLKPAKAEIKKPASEPTPEKQP